MYGFRTRDEARQALRNLRQGYTAHVEPENATYKTQPHSWRADTRIPETWGVARYVPYQRTNGNNEPRFDSFVWFI